ncbi:hypothetical protein VTO73DRAFT_8581 [Trametes versicolor]
MLTSSPGKVMWLLSTNSLELVQFNSLEEVLQAPCPWATKKGYAILSHVWARDRSEQSFADIERLRSLGVTSYDDSQVSAKIRGCVRAAKEHGFGWIWNDTCCIDKRSSAELEEAINSMFRWYAEAAMCLAYLEDVSDGCAIEETDSAFRRSMWFKRGWTLQELLAPHCLVFLSVNWKHLGTKFGSADLLHDITGIDPEVLTFHRALQHVSVARRMSWASRRETSRIEDQAYSLLGIFDVSMATIYGEGSHAFRRLQVKIMKRTADHTLFAWGDSWPPVDRGLVVQTPRAPSEAHKSNPSTWSSLRRSRFTPPSFEHSRSLFAPSPAEFEHAAMSAVSLSEVVQQVREFFDVVISPASTVHEHLVTSSGVRCQFIVVRGSPFWLALLLCKDASGQCVALPLWSQQDDFLPLFRAGISLSGSTYKYIPICSSTVQALRHLGWVPLTENVEGTSSHARTAIWEHFRTHRSNTLKRLQAETPRAAAPLATIQTVYIVNAHPSSYSHGLRRRASQLSHEPRLLYIPSWLAAYLALYDLELEDSPPLDEAIEPPSALSVVHLPHSAPRKQAFAIRFGSCGGRMFADVEFPSDGRARDDIKALRDGHLRSNSSYSSSAPRPGRSPPRPSCHATSPLAPHDHINSWKNGSSSFVDGKKEVRLSATPWPTPDSYCLEISLGGEHFVSLRTPLSQPERAPMRTSPQVAVPPTPPILAAETTTSEFGEGLTGSLPRHTFKRRGRNTMLSHPLQLLFQPPASHPGPGHSGAYRGALMSDAAPRAPRAGVRKAGSDPFATMTAAIGGSLRRFNP